MTEIVFVLTTETVASVVASGGTQPWPLNRDRAAACKYVVLCRNARKTLQAEETHGSAFMVGRIKDVVTSTTSPGRWLIQLSEYAEINWSQQRFVRKPIAYLAEHDYCPSDGKPCDFANLDFKPVRLPAALPIHEPGAAFQLTIAGAKAWLAASLCLPESSIEITIRA